MGKFKTEAIRTLRKQKQERKYSEPVSVPHGMRQTKHNKIRHKKALTAIHLATTAPGARVAESSNGRRSGLLPDNRGSIPRSASNNEGKVERYIPQKKG